MSRIAITGSSGYIGNYLSKILTEAGHEVIGLQRNTDKNCITGVEYIRYELDKSIADLKPCDFVIHTAYLHYSAKTKDAEAKNREGLKNLITYCRNTNSKLILLSTLSAHDKAKSKYGKIKLELESMLDIQKDVCLRLGLVLGEGGLYATLKDLIRKSGTIPLIGGGKQPMQCIALAELGDVMISLIAHWKPGKYNLAEYPAFPIKSLYQEIAKKEGKIPKYISVNSNLVLFATLCFETLGITLPITSESVKGLQCLRPFDTQEDQSRLGIELSNYKTTITGD